jgi:hypothetical protein
LIAVLLVVLLAFFLATATCVFVGRVRSVFHFSFFRFFLIFQNDPYYPLSTPLVLLVKLH